MSLLKYRSPGVLPRVVAISVPVTCIAVAIAESIMYLAWVIFWGGLLYSSVRKIFPTVWCIIFQMELNWGFLLVELTSLTLNIDISYCNSCPIKYPPLSCMHRIGSVYLEIQDCTNLDRTCAAVLFSIRINSTKLEAVSMQVIALNLTMRPLTLMFHVPIKFIVNSSQGGIFISCSGKSP